MEQGYVELLEKCNIFSMVAGYLLSEGQRRYVENLIFIFFETISTLLDGEEEFQTIRFVYVSSVVYPEFVILQFLYFDLAVTFNERKELFTI